MSSKHVIQRTHGEKKNNNEEKKRRKKSMKKEKKSVDDEESGHPTNLDNTGCGVMTS